MKIQVTIIGFGTMGRAIAKALSKNDHTIKVFGIDKDNSSLNTMPDKVQGSDFIILAIKPQDGRETIEQIKTFLHKKTVLISIMAGIPIKKLVHFSGHKKIVRMMPNLGLSVDKGIAVWKSVGLSGVEIKKARDFINKITENFEVKDEDIINKVTAISGSGPAYFFLLADSLVRACIHLGLSKKESRQLVEKTFSASAILGEGNDYSVLIKKIASKKGTTEAALKVFQNENFSKIVKKAIESAYKRAKEISHE